MTQLDFNMKKKIHYVWLGGTELPASVKSCIRSWKNNCPDWEIVEWNESNFPVNEFCWVKEAIEVKMYAFAADFIRLWVLYKYGGCYCDTDVEFLGNIESFINDGFVGGVENHLIGTDEINYLTKDGLDSRSNKMISGFGLQTGFIYSEPGHPYVKSCMTNIYEDGQRRFVKDDGSFEQIVIDGAMAQELFKYGFVYVDKLQHCEPNITIYDSSVIATRKSRNSNTVVMHWFDQSWKPDGGVRMKVKKFIKRYLYKLYRMS